MEYFERLANLVGKKDETPQPQESSEDQAFLRESFAGAQGYEMYISQAYNWRLISIVEAAALIFVIFVILYIGGQDRFVPYVIAVGPNDSTYAVRLARYASSIDEPVVKEQIKQFIIKSRSIAGDPTLENLNVNGGTYPMVTGQARSYIDDWYKQEQYMPFARMQNGTVEVQVTSVIHTAEGYTATWTEISRDKAGEHMHAEDWEASIGIAFHPPDEEPARDNPLGLYITSLNWTKKL